MGNFLFVDNSNLWIEGKRTFAVKLGLAENIQEAKQQNIFDRTWSVDFGKLLNFAGGDKTQLKEANLYGSRPPPNDSLWKMAEKYGFRVIVFDRNAFGKEKKVDAQINVDITRKVCEGVIKPGDEITLVAGDADFVPVCELAKEKGVTFDVVFWGHAAHELKRACSKFTNLDEYAKHITYVRKAQHIA